MFVIEDERDFWDKVDVDNGSCWLWHGQKNADGYGTYHGRNAARVAYELENGIMESYLVVAHSCRNPTCVNPSHMHLETRKDLMRDTNDRRDWEGRDDKRVEQTQRRANARYLEVIYGPQPPASEGRYEITPLRVVMLQRLMSGVLPEELAEQMGISIRTLQRLLYKAQDLQEPKADKYAVRLGKHPSELWGGNTVGRVARVW